MVWAEDPETGERALKRVVCLFQSEKNELVHLLINGEVITSTMGHPFFVQGKGWVAAGELVVGDKLRLLDGCDAHIDSISIEVCEKPVKVYNFEVEDFHTYFVGLHRVLVHNLCKLPGRSGKQARLRELMDDDKLPRHLRGELRRDLNAIQRGTRHTIRVPNGYDLAHRIGQNARDGFSYAHANLNMRIQHRLHHRVFGYK